MEWVDRMNSAMEYIENNLYEKMDYAKLAQRACCSVYHFQRMFAFVTGIPLSEYIRRRKMTRAAFELQNSDIKVIDLALKYGYDSPESFARAFQLQHGAPPSALRKIGAGIKAYPRLSFQLSIRGESEMKYRIIQKPAFELYGIEGVFDMKDGKNLRDIPQFWQDVMKDGRFVKLLKSTNYPMNLNAVCGYRELAGTTFPYMICALKTPLSDTEGFTVTDVPAGTWAVFSNEPHSIEETSAATQELIRRVHRDWLPTAEYEELSGFDIEMYYSTDDGRCCEEYWIRVAPKKIG